VVFPPDGQTVEDAVAAVFASARTAKARRHHLVPRSYLERWAVDGYVRATATDRRRHTFTTQPVNTAVESGYYSLQSDDLDPDAIPPMLMETILSRIEEPSKRIIGVLIEHGPAALRPEDAITFAMFVAFQLTRGRAVRAQIDEMANNGQLLLWGSLTDEGIREHLREMGSDARSEAVAGIRAFIDDWRAGHVKVRMQKPALVSYAAEAALEMVMPLLARPFRVYRSQAPLITCDEPVVPVPTPGHDLKRLAGIATAGVIIFPLDPHHLLAMFHPDLELDEHALWPELLPSETDELNMFIAAHSDRWLFEMARHTRTTTLPVPPLPSELLTMRTLAVENTDDGQRELINFCAPTRWRSASRQPGPPVGRWWRLADAPGFHHLPYDIDRMPDALYNVLD